MSTQLSDITIQMELLKHKQGQIKLIHTKAQGIIIWVFSAAQSRAYKKITHINNTPVSITTYKRNRSKLNHERNHNKQVYNAQEKNNR
jgi:uncharacterized protein (DUF2141 family)